MTIIEAIQKAESGALITNHLLKPNGFLKYIAKGIFFQYMLVDGLPKYRFEVREFSVGQILCNTWEVVEENYFPEPTEPDFEDTEEPDFQCCDNCDLPDACADFGCAIKTGVRKPSLDFL